MTISDQENMGTVISGVFTDDEGRQIVRLGPLPNGAAAPTGTPVLPPAGGYTEITSGQKKVTTAGTRVALVGVATPCKRVIITAFDSNTGVIAVGSNTVVASVTDTLIGIPLYEKEDAVIDIDDVSKIFIDSSVSGEGVSFTYLN